MTAVDIGMVRNNRRDQIGSDGLITHVDTRSGFEEFAAPWQVLQQEGLATPYQTLAWCQAWATEIAGLAGIKPLLVAGCDRRGRIVLLLPLGLRKARGWTVAEFLGGKHANFNMGLYDREAAAELTAADMKVLLKAVGDRHQVDLFSFRNQPLTWEGHRNPMALLAHTRSPDSGWKSTLSPDAEAVLRDMLSSERRKKLRAKERSLMNLGPISYSEARTPDDVDQALAAFLVQKRDRFNQLGIADPFAEPGVQAFLRSGTALRQDDGRRPISLFVMKASERVLAVFGGIIHRGRFTGMFTSFDGDPAVARLSPGELLLMNLVRLMCEEGIETFDLGTGDTAYKTSYCGVEEPLFDTLLPTSIKGYAASAVMGAGLSIKRRIKANDHAMALLANGRRLLRRSDRPEPRGR
jgi:CelD/BcsL family acetyltransferase involved in cellulose biosynthesis